MVVEDYMRKKWGERSDEASFAPLAPFSVPRFGRVFDDVLAQVFGTSPMAMRGFGRFTPRINVSETDSDFRVVAELPGIDEDDLDITLTREGLAICGEKREERRGGERNRYYESSYGRFERFIPINTEIDEDRVDASFDRGVLTITLPKSEDARARTRKVQIKSAGSGARSIDMNGGRRGSTNGSQKAKSSQRDRHASA